MTDIATTEPTSFIAGDFITWEITESDYPASDGWTLQYNLVNSDAQIQIDASADGDDHLVEIAASATASYTAGIYSWQARITSGTEIYTLRTGKVEILPNFETQTTGYDDRSFAKTCLDAIEAVLEGKASKDVASYSIQNRSLSTFSPAELMEAREKYRAEYFAEERRAGRKSSKIKVRFI